MKEEQRLHKLRERLDRVHETAEFYLPRHRNLFSLLVRKEEDVFADRLPYHRIGIERLLSGDGMALE